MFLSHAQLAELTGMVRPSAQCRQLSFLRIPFRKRMNGTPVVLQSDLSIAKPTRVGPNLDALK